MLNSEQEKHLCLYHRTPSSRVFSFLLSPFSFLSLSLSISLSPLDKMLSVVHAPLLYCWDLNSRALLVSTISLVVLRLLFDTVPQSLHCQTNCWTLYNCWTYQRNLKSLNTQFASVGFIFQCCPLCWHCRKRIGCLSPRCASPLAKSLRPRCRSHK